MLIRAMALVVSVVVLGCGESMPGEAEQSLELSSTEQAAAASCTPTQVCGSTCPAGQHIVSHDCSSLCGSNGNCGPLVSSSNAVTCAPNTEAFYQCGTTCPAGWLTYKVDYYSECARNTTSTANNRALCGKY